MADDLTPDPVVDPEAPPAEPEFSLPEDFADQVKSWEIDPAELAEAAKVYKALQNEEGVIDTFISTGQRLGFGIRELETLFGDSTPQPTPQPAPVAQPAPSDEDQERLMSYAEVQALLDQERQAREEAFNRQQQEQFQARQQHAVNQVGAWFDGQDVKDEPTRKLIASFGEKHLPPGADGFDFGVVEQALVAGKADYDRWVGEQADAYIAKKAAKQQAQPTPVGGALGGEEPETFSYEGKGMGALDAAKERVRQRLREQGAL